MYGGKLMDPLHFCSGISTPKVGLEMGGMRMGLTYMQMTCLHHRGVKQRTRCVLQPYCNRTATVLQPYCNFAEARLGAAHYDKTMHYHIITLVT